MSTAEYSRQYRADNRDRILEQEKARRANETPERRAIRLALKRANRMKHFVPRRKPRSKDEIAADRYAYIREWKERNHERLSAYAKKSCEKKRSTANPKRKKMTAEERKQKLRLYRYKYRWHHYQQCLAKERMKHRMQRDKNRINPYVEMPARRIPEYAENPAHARHLLKCSVNSIIVSKVHFSHALQSGLSTKGGIRW